MCQVQWSGPMLPSAGGDPALRRDGMAAGREDLGDAGGLQALLGRAHRRAQAGAAGADDDDVIDMVDDLVGAQAGGSEGDLGQREQRRAPRRRRRGTAARC